MAGIKKIFELGIKGVNLTALPFELDDSEVITATNLEPSADSRALGLQKRGGIVAINGTAINSGASIGGAFQITPNSIVTDTLYAGLDASAGTNTWRSTTNGTSWGFVTSPPLPQQSTKVELSAAIDMVNQRCVTYKGKLYYPGNSYTALAENSQPYVVCFDGTTSYTAAVIPQIYSGGALTETMFITDMYVFQEKIYIGTYDLTGAPVLGRVFEFTPETGTIVQVGGDFSGVGAPWTLCGWHGRLWVGTYSAATSGEGRIYSIVPGVDSTWVLRHTTVAGNGWITSMCNYRGLLYFATQADSGSTPHVRVSATPFNGSAWSNSDTGPSGNATANYDSFNLLTEFDDVLYSLYYRSNATPVFTIRKLVGGAWSTDYDIQANFTARKYAGQSLVWNNVLYYVIAEPGGTGTPNGSTGGLILRKTEGGAWAKVDDISARGMLGSVQV